MTGNREPPSGRAMQSRRTVLAALGTVGVAGLAGCSSVPFWDGRDDERDDVSLSADAVEPVAWPPSPFPVAVPPTLAEGHRERARELLATVPSDPSVPNRSIAAEIRSDRERVSNRLAEAVEEPWPTEGLGEWRGRVGSAATVRGTYRAATGESDADAVPARSAAVREELGAFVAGHEYRAASPLDAVLASAPIERLVADCRRRVRPNPAYPTDPLSRPFQAGEAVGRVELARAALGDARGLREAHLTARDDPTPQWAALIDATDRLRIAVSRTRSTVRDFLDVDEPPFVADLEDTAGYWLFTGASRRVEGTVQTHEDHVDDGEYATAVIEAGRALAAVEALRAAIDGIRDGAYQSAVTVDSVSRAAARAREAIAAVEESGDSGSGDSGSEGGEERPDRRLATQLARPALESLAYVPTRIEERYADATRVQGELAWIELYARAVPAATGFVLDRLE
ncbi:hypothetical protein [Halobellus sp. GM3]|uniref:hypothetical protein n=1 Tax=Halobellus sp. GM3 TaxID=3458410 RepID=UPI00403DD0D7